MENRLSTHLKDLRLSAIREVYKSQADIARAENFTYEAYLGHVVGQEIESRHQRRIERYIRESKLPLEKTFANFDRTRLGLQLNNHISTILDGSFLSRKENILAFGNPGSGKTHLLCAISHHLISQGHRIIFRTTSLLVQELLWAKRELRLPKLFKQLTKYEAIVLDDIGYVSQNREEMEVLFTLLAELYERGSILLTSNLPFSQWEKIFKDPMTTAAAIDRLVHHSIILELNLPSYRLEASQKNKKGGKK